MYTGLAGALLVFTGVWHATEWLMDGRRRDTMALVPVGLVYLVQGYLLVTATGGVLTQGLTLMAVATGGSVAFLRRDQFDIRRWVTWTFIVIDGVIVLALLAGLLG
ncbi:hypothetical protein [Pacificoceanicola onchidii]|uniref:hypothetical protein n=1 Tax=Pacificoceanicola onchidii TaxID=2562685 RepID=UPI0010A61E16|nr:hypothetical protein [Pacificoceanicola onchidii]